MLSHVVLIQLLSILLPLSGMHVLHSQYFPSNIVGPGDIRFSPELDLQVQHSIVFGLYCFAPNGLALSRLADCAYVGSVYNKRHRRL